MAIFDGCLTRALSQRERGPKPLRHESVKYMLTLYERELQYLLLLEPHVLRHWEGVQGDHVNGMLGYPRAHPHQGPQVDDRRKHHPLHCELLDAMQHGFPFAMVALPCLLLVQRIEVEIAPIGIGSFEVDERFRGLWIGSERCLGQKRSSHALQNWPW